MISKLAAALYALLSQAEKFSGVLTLIAGILSLYFAYLRPRRAARRKIIDAVYYHAMIAEKRLRHQRKGNAAIEKMLREDKAFIPYTPHSTSNDLTYDQIIDAMTWLTADEEEVLLHYFHNQAALAAILDSFESNAVKNFSQQRKLKLWALAVTFQKATLQRAIQTQQILDKRKKPKPLTQKIRAALGWTQAKG